MKTKTEKEKLIKEAMNELIDSLDIEPEFDVLSIVHCSGLNVAICKEYGQPYALFAALCAQLERLITHLDKAQPSFKMDGRIVALHAALKDMQKCQ